jgi:hypothetical protein
MFEDGVIAFGRRIRLKEGRELRFWCRLMTNVNTARIDSRHRFYLGILLVLVDLEMDCCVLSSFLGWNFWIPEFNWLYLQEVYVQMKTQQSVLQTSVVACKVSLGTLKSGANPPIDVCHNFERTDAELQYLREYSGCFGSFGCSDITFLFWWKIVRIGN